MMDQIRSELGYFFLAWQFLTRLPHPPVTRFDPDWLSKGAKYFSLVGALIGLLCGSLLFAAANIWERPIPALLAVAFGIAVTGALHEDGLADFFDGLGGADRQTRLAIMKDSRLGVYGALALGFFVTVRVFALSQISPLATFAALGGAHAGGRAAAVWVMATLPYSGDSSASRIRPAIRICLPAFGLSFFFGFAPALFLPPHAAAVALLAGAGASAGITLIARKTIGGYTGDVLGAAEQAYETAFLLGVATLA
jgi:adenosylcobinamide-GDP ribazoletransferase